MPDFLKKIVSEVCELIESGYYNVRTDSSGSRVGLRSAIEHATGRAVIAEVKRATPTKGRLTGNLSVERYVKEAEKAGVVGFSILTQPRYFEGSLQNLTEARSCTDLPLLMKDFVVSRQQVDAASRLGASAILLIQGIFDSNLSLDDEDFLVRHAHSAGVEVLTEVNNEVELEAAVNSNADMIGINHRNLRTLDMDMTLTERLMQHPASNSRVIVSESGINGPEEARRRFRLGADAILVGSHLIESVDVRSAAKMLVTANE